MAEHNDAALQDTPLQAVTAPPADPQPDKPKKADGPEVGKQRRAESQTKKQQELDNLYASTPRDYFQRSDEFVIAKGNDAVLKMQTSTRAAMNDYFPLMSQLTKELLVGAAIIEIPELNNKRCPAVDLGYSSQLIPNTDIEYLQYALLAAARKQYGRGVHVFVRRQMKTIFAPDSSFIWPGYCYVKTIIVLIPNTEPPAVTKQ